MVTYPEDWKEEKIGVIFDVLAGGDVKKEFFSRIHTSVHKYEVYSNCIENRGLYGYTSKAIYPENSLTVTARGTIGKAYYRKDDYDAIIRLLVLIPKSSEIKPKFYEYFINSQVQFDKENTGVPQLTVPKIKEKEVPTFTGIEQERIIETLEYFDLHIDNLTELMEKKRNIRDGALEDLVSGRTRLKGFHDAWIEYSFDDFFTLLSNNTLSRDKLSRNGIIGNIHYGDVLIKYQNCLTSKDEIPYIKKCIDTKSFKLLQVGGVIIADTAEDETVGKAIQICDVSIPVVGGLHTIICRPNYNTTLGYLGYYINSKCYHDQLYPYITGIKVSSISKKAIKTTFLKIPSSIDEQKEIVHIIAAMDEEIDDLESERDKIMQIREGAMDDLLTGRVRLKA